MFNYKSHLKNITVKTVNSLDTIFFNINKDKFNPKQTKSLHLITKQELIDLENNLVNLNRDIKKLKMNNPRLYNPNPLLKGIKSIILKILKTIRVLINQLTIQKQYNNIAYCTRSVHSISFDIFNFQRVITNFYILS